MAAAQGEAVVPSGLDLVHHWVQVRGIATAPIAEADESSFSGKARSEQEVKVEGKLGRALDFNSSEGKFVVQLLDEGVYVEVPMDNLVEYELPTSDQGGFDVVWPYHNDLVELGWDVSTFVATRGWCLLQVPRREELRERAATKASQMTFQRHKTELLPDFLGRKGAGKVTEIDPLKLSTSSAVISKLERGFSIDAVQRFDDDLSCLFAGMAQVSLETLGFPVFGRTEAMVWMPYTGSRERTSLEPEDLDDDDIEDGVVQRHLHFLKRRKLCFLYLVHTEGGRLTLYKKGDEEASQQINIPASSGKLLAFKCDEVAFKYEPSGKHLTMLSWVLQEAPKLEFSAVEGDSKMKDELYGIVQGPGAPYHETARVLAICCQVAGSCNDIEGSMNMYLSGTDANIYVPAVRFDTEMYFTKDGEADHISGRNSYQVHSGLCDDEIITSFDNDFFGIASDQAQVMPPNQRKILEVGYSVLYAAGYRKDTLRGAPIMVAIGDCGTEWATQLHWMRLTGQHYDGRPYELDTPVSKLDLISASTLASIGSRLSFNLGMTGPTFHVETACSSGLTAFCTTMYTMRTSDLNKSLANKLQGAVSGGVNLCTDPGIYIGNCAQHMLSQKGRCFTFDATATGYARGEGTSLLYTVFGNNQKDVENMIGAAIGNKVNQDGRSASMTAPNGPSQQACIRASMKEAQIMPRDVTTSECHGTGTALGDPIEVGSIRAVTESDDRQTPLYCTSSKSNIGHLEANAGTTGLIKCILMGRYGCAPANVHLKLLNPHLDASGWPAFFEADTVDYAANAGIAGVSSFGVSGTNSHAECWAKTAVGPNAAEKFASSAYEKLDQIKVTCPVTMGPIDYLTGEPIVPKLGPNGEKLKARADVLRDELASYDVSSYAYSGGYRFRREDLDEGGDELDEGYSVFICGSWSGWKKMQEMEPDDEGFYRYTLALGETRCESFFLCLNKSTAMRIYPALNCASPQIWIHGPDSGGEGNRWLIDGRDEELPAGTVYEVRFRWGEVRKSIQWERVDPKFASLVPRAKHNYSVTGTWSSWRLQPMDKSSQEEGTWESTIRLGPTGEEEFQFLRDNDPQQVIYPASRRSASGNVPVRGPDNLGKGKHFVVRGRADEVVRLCLNVDDARVTVSMSSDRMQEVTWESKEGWQRHDYYVTGSWSDWAPESLEADPDRPGIFTFQGTVRNMFSDDFRAFVEFFRIVVDKDTNCTVYPEAMFAGSGEVIVQGPDGEAQERAWTLKSPHPGVAFEITFEPRATDRRRIVTWTWLDAALALPQ